jgi:hypothetical protein
MAEFLSNPLSLVFALPIIVCVVGTVAHYWYLARKAELDANLKLEMIQRGMSAEDIRLVLQTSRSGEAEPLAKVHA